jgi:hypothetical protein
MADTTVHAPAALVASSTNADDSGHDCGVKLHGCGVKRFGEGREDGSSPGVLSTVARASGGELVTEACTVCRRR